MEQINCNAFYNAASVLNTAYLLITLPMAQWETTYARPAKEVLEGLLRGDVKFKLDESRPAAEALVQAIDVALKPEKRNTEGKLPATEIAKFNSAFFTFSQAIALELGRAPIFYVTPTGVYDTRRLIAEAEATYQGYQDRLPPEAIADTQQAGRCLAFELPTAAGFHIARAAEAVMKVYMAACNCPAPKDSQRNWGQYATSLKGNGANAKVVHHIEQLKDLHRNPMVHPDETLTMPEAISLWGMCVSVIQGMVADMESKKTGGDPAIAAMLPP